jgi:metallophosphoesterase superfamily enzyme
MGNHDILPLDRYEGWGLTLHAATLPLDPFLIAHDCVESELFLIHGHIHPGVRVSGRGRAGVAVSCFAQDAHRMILPAFGAFTGNYYLRAEDFERMYAVGDEEVIELRF